MKISHHRLSSDPHRHRNSVFLRVTVAFSSVRDCESGVPIKASVTPSNKASMSSLVLKFAGIKVDGTSITTVKVPLTGVTNLSALLFWSFSGSASSQLEHSGSDILYAY